MKLFTIGFAGKSAEVFFGLLHKAKIKTVVDIRLNNRSQLAGFTKAADLEFFLKALGNIGYAHVPELAPDQELLSAIRSKEIDWEGYTHSFDILMEERMADEVLSKLLRELPAPLCLLCSESDAANCHRSLVAKRIHNLKAKIEVIHL